jgi:nitrite reductase (NADH) small subunit
VALVKVGSLAEIPVGSVVEASVGDKPFALVNAGGEIHVLDGVCPHRQGPLGQGALDGHLLVCPWHAWEFDCRTGESDYHPEIKVKKYAVSMVGDDIFIDTP